jgi:hypothetical protein
MTLDRCVDAGEGLAKHVLNRQCGSQTGRMKERETGGELT